MWILMVASLLTVVLLVADLPLLLQDRPALGVLAGAVILTINPLALLLATRRVTDIEQRQQAMAIARPLARTFGLVALVALLVGCYLTAHELGAVH